MFGSLEPIADCAHVLAVIDDALDHLDELTKESFIDADGQQIEIAHYDIEFQNIDFSYGEGRERRQVLHNVNLKIPEYSVTAIVGPSGSGKSTICNLIARFYDATEVEMVEAAKKACCHDFIMALPEGYDTVIGEGGGSLSGGEKQRISIARAILKDAPIIILDEATASVDPENEAQIQKALSALTAGKTLIVIAHRLSTIVDADQIIVIENGCVAGCGKQEELLADCPLYANMWKAHQESKDRMGEEEQKDASNN